MDEQDIKRIAKEYKCGARVYVLIYRDSVTHCLGAFAKISQMTEEQLRERIETKLARVAQK